MMNGLKRMVPAVLAASLLSIGLAHASGVVTIYSADGLRDGKPNWFGTEFREFTKETGITVQYIEGGSGVVVNRVERERSNPQADVLVTLPPFIQKAAADGVLQAFKPKGINEIPAATRDPGDEWYPLVNNYQNYIYDTNALSAAPANWNALLNPKFKNKIQYSTPGQAGDGTAFMLAVFHAFGGKDAGFEYMKKLQANNVGPSSSTGKLTLKVNKGEIWVANGDLQMNYDQMQSNPNIRIFWFKNAKGQRWAFPLPYDIALVRGGPHEANGKKLIDFLLSKQAQKSVTSIAKGLPVRSDVHPTDTDYKELHALMKGVHIWYPNWNEVLKDLRSDVSRWHEVTGS